MESCGGTINVYSEADQGNNFHIYLPVLISQIQESVDQPISLPRGSEAVLFVDDEIKLANAGRRILEDLGYKLVVSTSCIEAYKLFCQNPNEFDLVITDLTMPHMTGNELANKIRQLRPNVPILMITGLNTQSVIDLGRLI